MSEAVSPHNELFFKEWEKTARIRWWHWLWLWAIPTKTHGTLRIKWCKGSCYVVGEIPPERPAVFYDRRGA